MNYLKVISNIKKADLLNEEYIAYKLNYEACNLIKEIAQKMYDSELDLTKYRLWEAIIDIVESLKHNN